MNMTRTCSVGLAALTLFWTASAPTAAPPLGEQTTFQITSYPVDAAFSPDGKWLATAGGQMDKTGEVKLWDLASGKERRDFKGHTDMVLAVAFAPDGKTLASAGWDRTVRLWDVATGKELAALRGHARQIWSVAFAPDGKLLASGSADEAMKLWDVATLKERATLRGAGGSAAVFSPDGRTLVTADDEATVRMWDVAALREKAVLPGHTIRIAAAVFAPDGKTLATASWDATVKLWDVATGRPKATLEGHAGSLACLAYSPDGKTLASACTYHRVYRHGGPFGGISKVEDGAEVKLWEATTGRERLTFPPDEAAGRGAEVRALAFGGDGKTLLTVSRYGTVKRWDLARLSVKPKAGK
jgi:WD40 repeat protein